MKSLKSGSPHLPADLSDPQAMIEALSNWDELSPEVLRAIERDPRHGPRLQMLRDADRALATMGRSRFELELADPCPTADELYDYGRGPGYGPIDRRRRGEIDRHVSRCMDCEFYVETLAQPPPLPLELERLHVGDSPVRREQVPWEAERAASNPWTRKRPLRRHVAVLAAAAAVLATGAVWLQVRRADDFSLHVPPAPVLRGESGGPLFFPRERVLAPTPALSAAWPVFDGSVVFEFEAVPATSEYRIEVSRHDDDAFALGSSIASQRTDATIARVDLAAAPGHYTWEVWAVIDGLDRRLGARDFQVVEDAELCAALEEIAGGAPSPRGRAKAVELLHAKGFLSDARAVARELPPGDERDAYLARIPGR